MFNKLFFGDAESLSEKTPINKQRRKWIIRQTGSQKRCGFIFQKKSPARENPHSTDNDGGIN